MFIGGQTPQYILRERPSYGLLDTDGYSNATHISCTFVRKLSSPNIDKEREGSVDRQKFVNLKEPHFMYPIYADQDLQTPQGNLCQTLIKRTVNR